MRIQNSKDPVNQRSRSANVPGAADEEVNENGDETPRSGVSTPKPDLQDKRLPGIMSYFSQVSSKLQSGLTDVEPENEEGTHASTISLLLPHYHPSPPDEGTRAKEMNPVKIPQNHHAPMRRQPSTRREGIRKNASSTSLSAIVQSFAPLAMQRSHSGPIHPILNRDPVHAHTHPHALSFAGKSSTIPNTPVHRISCSQSTTPVEYSANMTQNILDLRKKLTTLIIKSGPTTPTRALSAAQLSMADDKDDHHPASGTQTPRVGPNGAQVPAAKGRLSIKIIEAKGLRRSRDPYVVAVFQRNELISSGPRTFNDEEDEPTPPATLMAGGIPIQRQGSDSGRTMAIPMRSRQSSNTSVDHAAVRNRVRRSFTHPKWDAEAVL